MSQFQRLDSGWGEGEGLIDLLIDYQLIKAKLGPRMPRCTNKFLLKAHNLSSTTHKRGEWQGQKTLCSET